MDIEEYIYKQKFTITDIAKLVNKGTQTIRSWENKGIIQKPSKADNNWRSYSREDLANVLENIINYPWERKVIKNIDELQYIVDCIRGVKSISGINILGGKE